MKARLRQYTAIMLAVLMIVTSLPTAALADEVTVSGEHVHAYTPRRTADYEWLVRQCFRAQNRNACIVADNKPVRVEITAIYPIPKSDSKAEQERKRGAAAMVKPDIDNVAKIILDAMNDLAWHDDKQVVSLAVDKLYGEQPGVHVRIVEIGDEA